MNSTLVTCIKLIWYETLSLLIAVLAHLYIRFKNMKKVRNFPLLNESTPLRKKNPTRCWGVTCELVTLIAISLKLMKKYIRNVLLTFEFRNSTFSIWYARVYVFVFLDFQLEKCRFFAKTRKLAERRWSTKIP